MMDRLSDILNRFTFNAHVFFSGNLCGTQKFSEEQEVGHLHFLKKGTLTVTGDKGERIKIDGPSVLFFPRPANHVIHGDIASGVDLVCAEIRYPDRLNNPITSALPTFLHFKLNEADALSRSASWLFEEAFSELCGRQPMIDRLCDIFLINVLRKIMEEGNISTGMLAGLSHPQIANALTSIHQFPEKNWKLEELAEVALMSRSKFADEFKKVVGQTAGDYIADWRIALAQKLLIKKNNVNLVANEVGYENGSALARVFRKRTGMSPKEWIKKLEVRT